MQNPFADSSWVCDGEEGVSGSFYQWRPEGSPTIIPSNLGWQHLLPDYENKSSNVVTEKDSTRPLHGLPESLALSGQDTEPHGQFFYVPHSGASGVAVSSPFTKTEKAESGDRVRDDSILPKTGGLGLNQTGVANHSVDWTAWTWRQCENRHSSAVVIFHNSSEAAPLASGADGINEPLHEYFGSNEESDLSSEMHEDTAELDALLFSDDDDDASSEESEVDSTGHSPCLLTNCKEQIHESVDGILSAAEPSRNQKRKLLDGADSVATSVSSSANYNGIDQHQNKANFHKPMGEVCSIDFFPDSRKRMRRDEICQAVRSLENVVHGSKGKGVVAFLDFAIQYLESLRAKARRLGFYSSGS
ncbi:hypothetical protein MLD38_001011 [Melastoma candidum]|uniref:Uncharacterized protein n=1 Tax=Melastoma candidum TaxID=119954 RepID=A0ACB9SDU9_9MYRT|nr:hypothetical protein MLD38_001011 [Melastoma candidum]